MSPADYHRLSLGYVTVRKGNRRASASFWAHGHRVLLACCIGAIFVAFALFLVWTNHQSIRMGYVISGLHQERVRLLELNRELKVELANLTSLDRLEQRAREDLGLVVPQPEQVQVVR